MSRELVTIVPPLTEVQRKSIAAEAEALGFHASFFNDVESAKDACAGAEILFSARPAAAAYAPRLKWYCASSAGVNAFNKNSFACPDLPILTNSSGAYGVTLAEHALMLTLETVRRMCEYNVLVSDHEWRNNVPIRSIFGADVVLLGTGDIGKKVAERLIGFAPARITGVNRSGRELPAPFDRTLPISHVDEALRDADIIIMSLPGTEETDGLLNAERLAALKDGTAIINVGRGSAIDQTALLSELRSGRLSAGLDVFEVEPLPADDPIWSAPNLVITPHAAGNMTLPYTKQRIVDLFLEDLRLYAAGQPMKRVVNIELGY